MKKILLLSNDFLTLYLFRMEFITELIRSGHQVYISTPPSQKNHIFSELGCHVIPTEIKKNKVTPLADLGLIFRYYTLIRSVDPELMFSYTIKPNIYGAFISRFLGIKHICTITGTGVVFLKKSIIQQIAIYLYRLSIRKCYKVFFQNQHDLKLFKDLNMVEDNAEIIPGSGVNIEKFSYFDYTSTKSFRFLFVGRIMKAKGIEEFIECAKYFADTSPKCEFWIAGLIEDKKYLPILERLTEHNIVRYLGHCQNMSELYRSCHCLIFPSHGGEGIPNAILEAFSTGRTCIASDVPGVRDLVKDNFNGFLFKATDLQDLKQKVLKVRSEKMETLKLLGEKGREYVIDHYNRKQVVDRYLKEVS